MKRYLAAVVILLAARADAGGVLYRFDSVTRGLAAQRLSGTVEADGGRMRVNLQKADGGALAGDTCVITVDGGKAIAVVDQASRTWYRLGLDELAGSGGTILDQLRSAMSITVSSPSVTLRDLGPGPELEGYPTRHRLLETRYEIGVAAIGQKLKMQFSTKTESWATDRIPAQYTNVLDLRGLRSGVPEVDRLIEAQTASTPGFPLKQVSTTEIVQKGSTLKFTTTTRVSGIENRTIAPARFSIPAGFTRTESPLEKAMKALGGGKSEE